MNQYQDMRTVFTQAECLYDQASVELALQRMAEAITKDLADKCPLVIGVMQGAVVTLGNLITRLPFLLDLDYAHATRYQGAESGGDLIWKRHPQAAIRGRSVLLVDDILDRGITSAAIADFCRTAGAEEVRVAVLAKKHLPDYSPPLEADYVALSLPDRFVFGYGMDYQGYWRNAPGIYAVR